MYECMTPMPPYLLINRVAKNGSAAKPSLIATGIVGIKIGIDPKTIPTISPPNKDKNWALINVFLNLQ